MLADIALDRALDLVPHVDIAHDGDCAQALGIDLPIIVINLAHRTDRWQAISTRMAAVGLDKLVRMPAIKGAELDPSLVAALIGAPAGTIAGPPQSHLTLTPPAIGCFLSHLAIWRWLMASGLDRVLVFEDDANPAATFDAGRFSDVVTGPQRSPLTFLGRIVMHGLAETPTAGPLGRLYYFNGTFAYLIRPAACRALIPALLPLRGHIDHQISRVLIEQRRVLRADQAEPAFFEPDWSLRSDCYVPLEGETEADCELGSLLSAHRALLLAEGRPLHAVQGSPG
jgi:hypothetical protein